MLTYALFFIYLLFFNWLILKMGFIKKSGLPAKWLMAIFTAKVFCGVLYGVIYSGQAASSDSWQIYHFSLEEYHILLKSPAEFFRRWADTLVAGPGENYSDVFGTTGSFWNYLKDRVITNIEAIIDVFSFGRYYVNVIFYAFLTFGGYISFYRGLLIFYPGSRITSLLAVFFIPSAFFWTSGMYKDGILFMLLGYIVYQMAIINRDGVKKAAPYIKIFFYTVAIFILRNYMIVLLLPCLMAWWLSVQTPGRTGWYFGAIVAICILAFFTVPFFIPSLNFPAFLTNRRSEFMALKANTALPARLLEPAAGSYLATLPEALNFGFLRPLLWENKGLFYIPFAVELIVFYALLAFYFGKAVATGSSQYAFWVFSVVFLCCNWLLLGYIATVTGALIRYRSLYFAFPVAHLLYYNFPRLNTLRL